MGTSVKALGAVLGTLLAVATVFFLKVILVWCARILPADHRDAYRAQVRQLRLTSEINFLFLLFPVVLLVFFLVAASVLSFLGAFTVLGAAAATGLLLVGTLLLVFHRKAVLETLRASTKEGNGRR